MILAAAIGLAGAFGAVGRFLVDALVQERTTGAFPLGTLTVNVSGSFVLGVVTGLAWYHGLGGHAQAVVGIGLCGTFTTWSTLSWETVRLFEERLTGKALANLGLGIGACLLAAAAGIAATAAL